MNKNPKVDAFIKASDNPLKKLWEQIRVVVLAVDIKMEEEIKWGAPTFIYKGNLATFNPRAKKFVNLTFHTGATIADPAGVLEGDAKEARVFRVVSAEELGHKTAGLEQVVKNWIQMKDRGGSD
jgi:hypothetical protein